MRIMLNGELDHHSADDFRKKLDREILATGDSNVILDFSNLTFMDSSGLGVLLGRYKLFATRKLYIANASGSVDKLLRMSGIYTVIPEYKGGAV